MVNEKYRRPVVVLDLKTTASTKLQVIIEYVVPHGRALELKEISVAPMDSNTETYGLVTIAIGRVLVSEKRCVKSLTIPFDYGLTLAERTKIQVLQSTSDATKTIGYNAYLSGRLKVTAKGE